MTVGMKIQTDEPPESPNHPAEAIAPIVFVACCRTMAALREPMPERELEASAADDEFAAFLEARLSCSIKPPPAKPGGVRHRTEHGVVLWEDIEKMSLVKKPGTNEEQPVEPEPVDLAQAVRPFGVAKVVSWLLRIGLIEAIDEGLRGKPECYDPLRPDICLGLATRSMSKIATWVLGDDSPPCRLLPFLLRQSDGSPGFSRRILLVQGVQGGDETLMGLLSVMPLWAESRLASFERVVLEKWLYWARKIEPTPNWRAEFHAGMTARWMRVLQSLENDHGMASCILPGKKPAVLSPMFLARTPRELHHELDQHVIGQEEAKRQMATLIHYQTVLRMREGSEPDLDIPPPPPLLLAGPTGCGKTLLVSTACRLTGLPFLRVDASQLVPEGIVGHSLNDLGKRLINEFIHEGESLEAVRHAVVFFDEIDKLNQSHHGRDVIHQVLTLLDGGSIPLNEGTRGQWKPPASTLPCRDMLFIFGGAFQALFDRAGQETIGFGNGGQPSKANGTIGLDDLARAGFPREFLGRINRWVIMRPLSAAQLESVLLESRSSPLVTVNELLGMHRFRLVLSKAAARSIALAAARSGYGARALHQIVHEIAEPWLFDAPASSGKNHRITAKEVEAAIARLEAKGAFASNSM
jgi:ATP-dependent Clp protease ATP-binding subunit ClpX